ncbi:helix-turn-helix domain-containing protein [Pantoea allii]|uniref:helix-turn-helix domain-containing protein n=1 Tax=Pantoea allii TaxID=574096 RepID=UPI001F4E0085|nr:helix-turn-helix domain-containing protein [Pantoea allii]MCH9299010.1 helix-turn-helix domain-containing protein [Pantoea allii]
MHSDLMTLSEMAVYLGISQANLVRALCNQGELNGVPLPEALEHLPLTQRHWLREDVSQFKHALQRAHVVHHD